MPSLPIHDWQFWTVSVIALLALRLMLRSVLPRGLGGRRNSGTSKRATLTIGGKTADRTKPRR